MGTSVPGSPNGLDHDMTPSPEGSPRGFVAVNNTPSNASSVSSRLSSPPDSAVKTNQQPGKPHTGTYSDFHDHEQLRHKRKRSMSNDHKAYVEHRVYDYSPTRKPEPQHMAHRALHVLGNSGHNSMPYYSVVAEHHAGHTWPSDGALSSHPSVNGNQSNTSEEQVVGALQREERASEEQPHAWDHTVQAWQSTSVDQYSHDPSTGVTSVAPKRKRNFSNRTKTGCLTCRNRKKKCDEAQPVCNNCVRGGFTCKGYNASRRVMPTKPLPTKPALVKASIPLQSKDGQSDVSRSSTRVATQTEITLPACPASHDEGGPTQPIHIDDNDGQRQPQLRPSPPRSDSQNRPTHAGHQPWPPQQRQSSYTSDPPLPPSQNNRQELPLHAHAGDMALPSLSGADQSRYPLSAHQSQPPTPILYSSSHPAPQAPGPGTTHALPGPTSHQPSHWHQPQLPKYSAYPPAPGQGKISTHSRMSSSNFEPSRTSFKISGQEDVEKSRMLRSVPYSHFDPTLVYERQRCERALKRFEAGCELDSGLTEHEVRNLFLKVVDPSQDTTHKFPSQNFSKGHLGLGVKIEAPFTCTYGYNLKIQDDVYIGKGCTFDDSGSIEIGPRTIIAPGVTIVTTDYAKDLLHRKGTKSLWTANGVAIASGVVIGANALIYPGVKIDEGATVEPGAIVRESLKANQIQRASPAQVIDSIPY